MTSSNHNCFNSNSNSSSNSNNNNNNNKLSSKNSRKVKQTHNFKRCPIGRLEGKIEIMKQALIVKEITSTKIKITITLLLLWLIIKEITIVKRTM